VLRQTPRAGFTVSAQLSDSIELLLPTVCGWRNVLDCALLSVVLHGLTSSTLLINANRTLPGSPLLAFPSVQLGLSFHYGPASIVLRVVLVLRTKVGDIPDYLLGIDASREVPLGIRPIVL
jgi:hypothetical protein